MKDWHIHLKQLLIAAGILAVCCFGVHAYVEMRVKLTQIQTASAEKIKANEKTAAVANGNIAADQKTIAVIDQETKSKVNGLQAQLDSKPDSAQIKAIIQAEIPGLKMVAAKDAQGNAVVGFTDTPENREAVNRKDVEFKTCKFDLDGCQQKQARYLDIIANKDTVIAAKQATIDTQAGTIKELTRWGKGGNIWARTGRVIIPATCGAAGAGLAAQGKISGKGVAIAALASAATCAFTIRF